MEANGRLEGVQQYRIHDSVYVRAYFVLLDDLDDVIQCQLPIEAFDAGLKPGDPIRVTFLMRTVMEIRARQV